MPRPIQETDFLDILKDGVSRTVRYMGQLTEYRGGPTTTEYILTTDIARAFLDKCFEVRVEYLNRHLVNTMTRREGWNPREKLSSKRTDVAVVGGGIMPRAIIEVKIGVGGKLSPIRKDLIKIVNTIECMKACVAVNVRAASVFQIYVPGRASDVTTDHLKKKLSKIETKLKAALENFANDWTDFDFQFVSLQEKDDGFVAREVVEEDDGTESLGEEGHATRYYAVLIRSKPEARNHQDLS